MKELWQNLQQLRQSLIDANILHTKPKNPNRLMRSYNWKTKCSKEILEQINILSSYFQNENEFWSCISYNINPFTEEFICPVCKTNRLKYVGRQGSRFFDMYNSTCRNCSANQVPKKRKLLSEIALNRTPEENKEIQNKIKATRLEHFGDPNYGLFGSKGFKQTMLNKYGDEHYSNHEKAKQTCLERYGVECNFQTEEFKKKSLATKIKKYGCGHNVEKMKETNLQKYGVEYYTQTNEFQEKANAAKQQHKDTFSKLNNCTSISDCKNQYGQGWLSLDIPRIYSGGRVYIENKYLKEIESYYRKSLSKDRYQSSMEVEMQDYIKDLDSNIVCNTQLVIPPYEVDVYLPDKNLAFEFDGIYWHSLNYGKDFDYHLNKTLTCMKKGITLIHIFEDTWINDRQFCEQLIRDAINKTPYYETIIDRCYYYPQDNRQIIKTTEPRAFYFKKNYDRIYVTNENIQELINKNYLVCYDCGQVILERTDEYD